jgi:endoglucanase
LQNLISKLCATSGVSGGEKLVAEIAADELSKCADIYLDTNFNNVFGRIGSARAKKRVLLDAHIDQIGLIVTRVEDGFLRVASCGSLDSRILAGSAVKIFGKQELIGVVSSVPPHLSDKKDKITPVKEICIDTALSKEEAENLIPIGSYVAFLDSGSKLLGKRICACGLDNRSSVAALILCARLIHEANLDWDEIGCSINFLFSSREEIGGYVGAKIGSYVIDPTEAIVLDVSFATQPGVDCQRAGELSKGPLLGVAPSLSKRLLDVFSSIAFDNNIPYQLEVMSDRTGTNADAICTNAQGVETFLVSMPLRYMHTPYEVMDLEDIENTVRLLSAYFLGY